jgi:hypothetical protein
MDEEFLRRAALFRATTEKSELTFRGKASKLIEMRSKRKLKSKIPKSQEAK